MSPESFSSDSMNVRGAAATIGGGLCSSAARLTVVPTTHCLLTRDGIFLNGVLVSARIDVDGAKP